MKNRIVLVLLIVVALGFTGGYYYLLENYWFFVDAGDVVFDDGIWDKFYIVYIILMLISVVLTFKYTEYILVSSIYLLLFPGVYYFSDYVSYESVKDKFYTSAKAEYPYYDLITVNLKQYKFTEVEKILSVVEEQINKGEGDEFSYRNTYLAFYTADLSVIQAIKKWDKEKPSYHSKYALGISYLSQGWGLRGNGFYSDIPKENLPQMKDLFKSSVENFKKSLHLKNGLWVSYYYLINSLAVSGKKAELKQIFNESIIRYPYSYLLRHSYYAYSLRSQWGGSVESIRLFALEARSMAKYNPRLMSLYGFYYVAQSSGLDSGDKLKKIALYEKALEYAPLTEWFEGLEYNYFQLKDYRNKIKYRTLILNKILPKEGGYISRAYTYSRLYKVELALADAHKELELFPDYLSGSNQAGWLFYKHEKYDEAIISFKNSIRIDPTHHYAYRLLGDLYFSKTHQLEKALEMYLKAQALDASEVKLDLLIADVMYDLKRSEAHNYLVRYLERVDTSDLKNKKNIEVAKVLQKDIASAKWFIESNQRLDSI